MKKTESQTEIEATNSRKTSKRTIKLYILGFAKLEGEKIKLTEAGKVPVEAYL